MTPRFRNHVPKDISSGASGARQVQELQEAKRFKAEPDNAMPAPVVM